MYNLATPPRQWHPNDLSFRVSWRGPRLIEQYLPALHAEVLNQVTQRAQARHNHQDSATVAVEFYNLISFNNYQNDTVNNVVCQAADLLTIIVANRGKTDDVRNMIVKAAEEVIAAHRNAFAAAQLSGLLSHNGQMAVAEGANQMNVLIDTLSRHLHDAQMFIDNNMNQRAHGPGNAYGVGNGYGGSTGDVYAGNNQQQNQSGYGSGYSVGQQNDNSSMLGGYGGVDSLAYTAATTEPTRDTSAASHVSSLLGDISSVSYSEPVSKGEVKVNLSQDFNKQKTSERTVGSTEPSVWMNARRAPAFEAASRGEPIKLNERVTFPEEVVRRHYNDVLNIFGEMSPFDEGYGATQDNVAIMSRNVGEALAVLQEYATATPETARRRSGWYLRTITTTKEESAAFYGIRSSADNATKYAAGSAALWTSLAKSDEVLGDPGNGFVAATRWMDSILADIMTDYLRGHLGIGYTMYHFGEEYEAFCDAISKQYGDDSDKFKGFIKTADHLVRTLVQPFSSDMEKNFIEMFDEPPAENMAVNYVAIPMTITYVPLPPEFFGAGRLRRNQLYVTTRAENKSLMSLACGVSDMVDGVDNFYPIEDYVMFRDGTTLRFMRGSGGVDDVVAFYRV